MNSISHGPETGHQLFIYFTHSRDSLVAYTETMTWYEARNGSNTFALYTFYARDLVHVGFPTGLSDRAGCSVVRDESGVGKPGEETAQLS